MVACDHVEPQGGREQQTMLRRTARTIELRDHVMPLIQARGTLLRTPHGREFISRTKWICTLAGETQPIGADRRMADGEPLLMFDLRTPFSNWFTGAPKYAVAVARQKGSLMSYGLDIWRLDKVLNLEWAEGNQEHVKIISFRRGAWEDEVMALK
jgi:hypothetical protein